MGKGDKKSRKGKIWIGSFGVSRPKKLKNRKSATHNTGGNTAPEQKAKKGNKGK